MSDSEEELLLPTNIAKEHVREDLRKVLLQMRFSKWNDM